MGGYEHSSKSSAAGQESGEQAPQQAAQRFPPGVIIGSVGDVIAYIEKRPDERDPLLLALQG